MRELTDLEKGVQAYEMQEIRNLMARYEYYHTAKMHRQTLDLFAQHTPGVYIDNSSLGRYEGLKGVEEFFVKFHELLDGDKKGSLCIHPITTEMLEIARDGKTARGLWSSPGMETRVSNTTGALEAYWVWGKYLVDFVKEDGVWKFWHFYITDHFQCDYHTAWTEKDEVKGEVLDNPLIPKADGPSQYPGTVYSSTHIEELVPPLPEPYETFDEAWTRNEPEEK